MATNQNKNETLATRREQTMDRPYGYPATGPFRLLNRMAAEMDRVFDEFLGRQRLATGWDEWPASATLASGMQWIPDVEIHQQDHELVVRADLPGIKKDDVKVDVTEDAIRIDGERRQEERSERGGLYRTERSYGRFSRTIPLPEGAITDQAKATFNDGVLEIRMPAPPEHVSRGRRLEIHEGASASSGAGERNVTRK